MLAKAVTMMAVVAPAFGMVVDHKAERQAMIDEINETPGITWKAAMNERFRDLPLGSSKSLIGARAPTAEEIANMDGMVVVPADAQHESGLTAADIPQDFDSRTGFPKCAKVIGDIRDQSMCGCCWAFGSAEAASDRLCISTDGATIVPLSAQDLCFNSNPDGCNGGAPEVAWDYIKKTGIVSGKQQKFSGTGTDPDPFADASTCSKFSMPHCHHHGPVRDDPFPAEGTAGCPSQKSAKGPTACDSDSKLTYASDKYTFTGDVKMVGRNETYLQAEIMTNGPVTVAFTVYSDFENYAGGVYVHKTGTMAGGHAVKMLGWGTDTTTDTDYWLVANSWNPYWGEKGYFRIKRGKEDCGIAESAVAAAGDAKWVVPGPDMQ